MSGPIFGNNAAATGSSGGNRHLVEFCAGRMTMTGKMVTPDNRKGLVYLYQAEDGLIHFCWKDRSNGKVEDDLIIFPDDCEFLRIEQCKTGRVYVLKFKSSSRRLFFWLQEAKTDKDDEWCRRVNDIMNNPPTAGSMRNSGESSDLQYMLNNMSQQQLMQLFGGTGPMRGLGSLLGSMNSGRSSGGRSSSSALSAAAAAGATPAPSTNSSSANANNTATPSSDSSTIATPSTPTNQSITTVTPQAPRHTRLSTSAVPATPTGNVSTVEDLATAIQNATGMVAAAAANNSSTTAAGGAAASGTAAASGGSKYLLTELQSYLSGLQTSDGQAAGGAAAAAAGARNVDLSAALSAETVGTLADDGALAASLVQHLPTIESTDSAKQQLKDTVASPQFRQALSTFSSALQSGQLGPVVSQFQLDGEAVAAANSGDLEQFVRALERKKAADKPADEAKTTEPMEEDKPDA